MRVFCETVGTIAALNTQLRDALRRRVGGWAAREAAEAAAAGAAEGSAGGVDSLGLGDVFERFAPLFKMYDEYSRSFEFASGTFTRHEQASAPFRAFLARCRAEHAPRLRGLTLQSFLIMPIQRIPRYVLLLKARRSSARNTRLQRKRCVAQHTAWIPHCR